MTEKERAEWQRRCMRFQESIMNTALKPSTEARLDWLEADASAQRTAILLVERKVEMLASAIAFACIVALVLSIALEVLT